jgi:hypothetical protein
MKKDLNFSVNLDGDISKLESKLTTIKNSMSGLFKNDSNPQMVKAFETIEKALDRLRSKAATPINSASAFTGMVKETQ